jgi:hypothetical protein
MHKINNAWWSLMIIEPIVLQQPSVISGKKKVENNSGPVIFFLHNILESAVFFPMVVMAVVRVDTFGQSFRGHVVF